MESSVIKVNSSAIEKSLCTEIYGSNGFVLKDSSTFLRFFGLTLFLFGVFFFTGSLCYFLYHRQRYEYLKKRSLVLLLGIYFSFMCLMFALPFRSFIGAINYSCTLQQVLTFAGMILSMFCILMRIVKLQNRIKFNHCLIEVSFSTFDAVPEVTGLPPMNDSAIVHTSSRERSKVSAIAVQNSIGESLMLSSDNENPYRKSFVERCFAFPLYSICCWKPPTDLAEEIQFDFFLTTDRFIFFVFALLGFVPLSILVISLGFFFNVKEFSCTGCTLTASEVTVVGPSMFVVFVFGIIVLRRLDKFIDALGVKQELKVYLMVLFVFFFLFGECLRVSFPHLEREAEFQFALMTCFGMYIACFHTFVYSVWRAKKLERAVGSPHKLDEILESPRGSKAFALYLAYSLALENLLFIQQVKRWKLAYKDEIKPYVLHTAIKIVSLYINECSAYEVNISYATREKTKDANIETISLTFFDSAVHEVRQNLASQFTGFTQSNLYRAYIGAVYGAEQALK